jgi:hypothetical protein
LITGAGFVTIQPLESNRNSREFRYFQPRSNEMKGMKLTSVLRSALTLAAAVWTLSCPYSSDEASSRAETPRDFTSRTPKFAFSESAGEQEIQLKDNFVNGRQCVAIRVHPSRADSLGVSLLAQGQAAELRSLVAWPMNSIFERE